MKTVKQKQEGIQHTKARLGESLKKKWGSIGMHDQHVRRVDSLLVKKTRFYGCRGEI